MQNIHVHLNGKETYLQFTTFSTCFWRKSNYFSRI